MRVRCRGTGSGARRSLAVALAGISLACGFQTSAATAAIYSANDQGGIDRTNNDGSYVVPNIITPAETGETVPTAIAVDSGHIYFAAGDAIMRSDLDGSNLDADFIADLNIGAHELLVADDYLYWAAGEQIGRADLDGSDVNEDFLPTPGVVAQIAANSTHLYWIDHSTEYPDLDSYDGLTLGRADLDGTNADRGYLKSFVTQVSSPSLPEPYALKDLAADEDHAYFVVQSPAPGPQVDPPLSIGRIALDGLTPFEPEFIESEAMDDAPALGDLVQFGGKLYWNQDYAVPPNFGQAWLGRADVDGTDVYPKFNCAAAGSFRTFGLDASYDAFPGTEAATNFACMLYGHSPNLKYADEEAFYATSMWDIFVWGDTELGIYTHDETAEDPFAAKLVDGSDTVLASTHPYESEGIYTADELWGDGTGFSDLYAGTDPASSFDSIAEPNDGPFFTKYLIASELYNSHSGSQYGHIVRDEDGNLWLQYWFFMYYNEFALGVGDHEGDWEGIAVRLDDNNQPDKVIFNQHHGGAACDVEDVEWLENGVPTVYVATGSHASYPVAASWETVDLDPLSIDGTDESPGDGVEERPLVEILDEAWYGAYGGYIYNWIDWPGEWGNTDQLIPADVDSPRGPKFHSQWSDPGEFEDEAIGCFDQLDVNKVARKAPPAPRIRSARVRAEHVTVRYRVSRKAAPRRGWPLMRLTLDVAGDGQTPLTIGIRHVKGKGRFTFPLAVDRRHRMVVRARVVNRRGVSSRAASRAVQGAG